MMAKMEPNTYTIDELSYLIYEKYEETMNLPESVIKMILSEYVRVKGDILNQGDKIVEDGIGEVYVKYRRVPESFSKDRFTVKLDTDIDPDLKEDLMNSVKSSETLREKLGVKELP